MLTTEEATARVARGAAHLDQVKPGWFNRIDVGLLEIGSCQSCVAAQLVTGRHDYPFTAGLRELGLVDDADRGNTLTADHGMGLKAGDYGPDEAGDVINITCFTRLQDAWIAAIADRRLAAGDNKPTEQPDDKRGTQGEGFRPRFPLRA